MSYVDLQVNGAYGVDFNEDELTLDQFVMACQRLRNTGVVAMLPTIITDSVDTMCKRIAKLANFLDQEPSSNWFEVSMWKDPFFRTVQDFTEHTHRSIFKRPRYPP